MPGPIARCLADAHARLEALLESAVGPGGEVDRSAFDAFRAGLLRHIAVEEKIVLPAAREARGGEPLAAWRTLRIHHGALASLLVPSPTAELVGEIRSILGPHDELEEGPGGVYDECDALLAGRADEIVERLRAYPPVKVAAYFDGARVLRRAEDALRSSAKQFEGR